MNATWVRWEIKHFYNEQFHQYKANLPAKTFSALNCAAWLRFNYTLDEGSLDEIFKNDIVLLSKL